MKGSECTQQHWAGGVGSGHPVLLSLPLLLCAANLEVQAELSASLHHLSISLTSPLCLPREKTEWSQIHFLYQTFFLINSACYWI